MNEAETRASGELRLEGLPNLPQAATVRALAERIWANARVVALWLGGSLASGAGDQYSDIDLRLALAPDDLPAWEACDLAALLNGAPLAHQFIRFGPGAYLRHLIAPNGDILDLVVRSVEIPPEDEPSLVLGCRDDAYAALLTVHDCAPASQDVPATAEGVRELLEAFWVNSHKHRKVLHRNLDLMFPAAMHANWRMLMTLWHIAATGNETSARHFSGIHGLTELVRGVESTYGSEPLATIGAPIRTREEICAVIERDQEVVAQLGRQLAARYHFAYPEALERTVRAAWAAFRAEQEARP